MAYLASESKKRIEDANLERDRARLKESQLLQKISRLESDQKADAQEWRERQDRVLDALKSKHKNQMLAKADEISDLSRQLSDAVDKAERCQSAMDSKSAELSKLHEQLRSFKDDTSSKYESYNKQLSAQESLAESRVGQLSRENERLTDANEQLKAQTSQTSIRLHEQEVKLDSYVKDYERLFDENKRLRELTNSLREDKDAATGDLARVKAFSQTRLHEVSDQAN